MCIHEKLKSTANPPTWFDPGEAEERRRQKAAQGVVRKVWGVMRFRPGPPRELTDISANQIQSLNRPNHDRKSKT